ncbi:MAG: electron transport complex subunit E [Bacilli bacterium]|nr:electron transport complex subunit E [Bacilli bacterium]
MNKQKQNFLKGIIEENPLFVSILGTCPALAVTKSLEAAIGMGLLFTIVLVCSNLIVSLLRKIIPEEIKTPAYILIIATFVTMVKMLSEAFLPDLYSTLGVFISLIVVNCIVLGRAESYASKNGPISSFIDGLGMGVGYSLSIMLIGIIREILGTGMISLGKIFTFIPLIELPILKGPGFDYSISLFSMPAGAFIILGFILAIIAFVKNCKKDNELATKRFNAQNRGDK